MRRDAAFQERRRRVRARAAQSLQRREEVGDERPGDERALVVVRTVRARGAVPERVGRRVRIESDAVWVRMSTSRTRVVARLTRRRAARLGKGVASRSVRSAYVRCARPGPARTVQTSPAPRAVVDVRFGARAVAEPRARGGAQRLRRGGHAVPRRGLDGEIGERERRLGGDAIVPREGESDGHIGAIARVLDTRRVRTCESLPLPPPALSSRVASAERRCEPTTPRSAFSATAQTFSARPD